MTFIFFNKSVGQLVSQPLHITLLKFHPMPFLTHCWSLQKSFWENETGKANCSLVNKISEKFILPFQAFWLSIL